MTPDSQTISIRAARITRYDGDTRREAETRAVARCLESLGLTAPLSHLPSGKPVLPENPDATVSVSHSAQWAVVAVTAGADQQLGIDVECRTRPQLRRIAPRVFSGQEIAAANAMPCGLAMAWTAKEAVFKAFDHEGTDFTEDIALSTPLFDKATFVPNKTQINLSFLTLEDDNILCVASQGNNFDFKTL